MDLLPNMDTKTSRRLHLGAGVMLALGLVVVYVSLHGIYRPENGDDAWSLSFLYNYLHKGIESDVTFGTADGSGGQNGTELFSKLQALIYGPVLDRTGWTRSSAHLISIALMVAAAAVWGAIAAMVAGAGADRIVVGVLTALLLLMLEPFFGAANQARPDALAFLFCSLSLFALLRSYPVVAGLLAVAAFETHPMGAIVGFYLLAALAARNAVGPPQWKPLGRDLIGLAVGGLIGVGCYALLHMEHLHKLPSVLLGGNGEEGGGYLVLYFFRTRYLRHLPELALFAGCAAAFVAMRGWRRCPLAGWFVVSVLVSTVVLRRPNFHYAIYPYPAFLMLAVCVFQSKTRLWLLAVLLLGLMLPQYALAWRMNRGFNFDRFLVNARAAVPGDGLPVVGNPNSWFAFRDRAFYATDYGAGSFDTLRLPAFYLVENNAFREDRRYAGLSRKIREEYELVQVKAFSEGRDRFEVFRCARIH